MGFLLFLLVFAFLFAWMQTMHNILMDAASHLVIHNPHVNACERNFIQCLGMLIQILLIMYLAMYFIFVLSPQNFTATNYAEE